MTTPPRTNQAGGRRSRAIDVLLGMLLRATGLALWVASAFATLGFLVEFVPVERASGRPDGLVGLAAVVLGVAARFCTVQGRRLLRRARPMIGEPGAPTDTRRLDALSPDDLAQHPVWEAVDSCYPDGGVAVRPRTGVDAARTPGRMFARATFVLVDGRAVSGYLVPAGSDESLEALRPVMTTGHGPGSSAPPATLRSPVRSTASSCSRVASPHARRSSGEARRHRSAGLNTTTASGGSSIAIDCGCPWPRNRARRARSDRRPSARRLRAASPAAVQLHRPEAPSTRSETSRGDGDRHVVASAAAWRAAAR